MKKTTIVLLLAVGCCYSITIRGQNLAAWNLTSNAVATYQSTHVNAGKLTRGDGISTLNFTPNGSSAHAWEPFPDISSADYYQICLRPKPGYTLDVGSFSFREMRTADGILAYRLKWSLDGFETFSVLDDVNVPDNTNFRQVSYPNLDIQVCDGEELCFRWYAYQSENYTGEWYLSNVVVTGTEAPACNPPAMPPSNLSVSNVTASEMDVSWTAGGGNATLVLAREGSPVGRTLCGGNTYAANPAFGLGAEAGPGIYVVYDGPGTSFTMTGLKDGATYYLTAMGYNTPGHCYQKANLPVASATALCAEPNDVAKLLSSPSDGKVSLAWEAPFCYDEVMVVASEQQILSMPANADPSVYTTNAAFSPGAHGSADFTAGEALVYRGTATKMTVTGLDNTKTYYFKIYTFLNGIWAAGAGAVEKPQAGCVNLGGDFIYVNELHFTNQGEEVDKGIEIAGKAGVKLENYVLAIYTNQSNLERIIKLSGAIDDEGYGYGAIWIPDPGLFFASAIALVNMVTGVTTDFIAHRVHGVVANDGPAEGQPAYWQGQNEDPNTPVNYSIQRQGDIACPNTSQPWAAEAPATRGQLNFAQSLFPIALISFEGEIVGERVLLSWKTETEENNDFMAVEHSTDARRFTEVGRLKGAGTSSVPQAYSLWHDTPRPGINYYRLRQVDFDGAATYHGIVAVDFKGKGSGIRIYPSLVAGQLTVELSAPSDGPGALLICDIHGRPVQLMAVAAGLSRQELDVSALLPGNYILQWRPDKGQLLTDRFVKL